MATAAAEKTLYARLGGYDVIASIVDEFLGSFSSDPRVARFSAAMSLESRRRNRQLTVDYLCEKAGGPVFYLGKDMKTAHAGLGIKSSEWQIAMEHTQRALAKFKVPDRESKEFLDLFSRLSHQIIER